MTQTVWVTRYDDHEFADLEGIYSTKEKALNAVQADAERCEWTDMVLISEGEGWAIYMFHYKEMGVDFITYTGEVCISRKEIE